MADPTSIAITPRALATRRILSILHQRTSNQEVPSTIMAYCILNPSSGPFFNSHPHIKLNLYHILAYVGWKKPHVTQQEQQPTIHESTSDTESDTEPSPSIVTIPLQAYQQQGVFNHDQHEPSDLLPPPPPLVNSRYKINHPSVYLAAPSDLRKLGMLPLFEQYHLTCSRKNVPESMKMVPYLDNDNRLVDHPFAATKHFTKNSRLTLVVPIGPKLPLPGCKKPCVLKIKLLVV